jgi:hypothetical protein
MTAAGGPLIVHAREGGGLRAVSADSRSVTVVDVADGRVGIAQERRPAAARALLDDGTNAYMGWVTGDATCAHDDAHCARRLTGLARVRDGEPEAQAEVWLAVHPALAPSRSFVVRGSTLWALAAEPDGTMSQRVFALPDPWPAPSEAAPATGPGPEGPLVATSATPIVAHDAVVIEDRLVGPLGADASADAELLRCDDTNVAVLDAGRVTVFYGMTGMLFQHIATAPFPVDIRPPLRGPDGAIDAARCVFDESGGSFAWIDRDDVLRLVPSVDAPADMRTELRVADHVAGFAMARHGDTVLLATWGQDGERQVTLRRVWHGRVLGAHVAAACWDDGSGLCGPAGLAIEGRETILYAREETDLEVLRVDGAGNVAALPGLE